MTYEYKKDSRHPCKCCEIYLAPPNHSYCCGNMSNDCNRNIRLKVAEGKTLSDAITEIKQELADKEIRRLAVIEIQKQNNKCINCEWKQWTDNEKLNVCCQYSHCVKDDGFRKGITTLSASI